MARGYYTYCHKKSDSGEIFYVGKGFGRRAFSIHNRNTHWKRTVAKHGFEAVILDTYDTEQAALSAEVELIASYRASGVTLVNLTDGGEGWSGRKHTEATRQLIAEMKKGQVITPEQRVRISAANKKRYLDPEERIKCTQHFKGKPSHRRGKKLTEETRMKMSVSRRGRPCSDATKQKIAEANRGKVRSEETRQKIAELKTGVKPSLETRRKLSESVRLSWTIRKEKLHGLQS